MSGGKPGVRAIMAEEIGGANDGGRMVGLQLDGAPAAVLIVTADGHALVQSPRGLRGRQLLEALTSGLDAVRPHLAGDS